MAIKWLQCGLAHNKLHISVGCVMFLEGSSKHQGAQAKKKTLNLLIALDFTSQIFEDQGTGYPLKIDKVTLKWTGPVKRPWLHRETMDFF